MWTGGCFKPHNRLCCFFCWLQGHSSGFSQRDPTHVAVTVLLSEACGWMWCQCVPFLHGSPCWWGLGYLYLAPAYRWCLHDPFIFINIKMISTLYTQTHYSFSTLHPPLLTPCTSVCRKKRRSIDFLKLPSDVEWFSSPHAPPLVWTLRMSLSRAGQGWITQTHWWIWMRPCPPSCLHSSGNDGSRAGYSAHHADGHPYR